MELNAKKCVMVIDEALPLVLLQILLALWELRLESIFRKQSVRR